MQAIQSLLPSDLPVRDLLILAGIGLGAVVLFVGLSSAFLGPDKNIERLRALGGGEKPEVRRREVEAHGIFSVFVPQSKDERNRLERRMYQAGIYRPGAVRNYHLVRAGLGFLLPIGFVGLKLLAANLHLPGGLDAALNDLNWTRSYIAVTILVVVGFYAPGAWLKNRIDQRRGEIEQGLPNALDLLQVALEAGMGFDSAMARVAKEIVPVCPPIAQEFMSVQLEIQAGMGREKAFMHLSERTGVDEVAAFSNVILQSARFGSSVSGALSTYAEEMRVTRELKAQEKANKLPVKMSAVLAAMMMPVLLMITLTPVVLRWVRMFEGG